MKRGGVRPKRDVTNLSKKIDSVQVSEFGLIIGCPSPLLLTTDKFYEFYEISMP